MMDVLLKIEPGAYVTCICMLLCTAGDLVVSVGDRLGVDCPGGRKKAAREQA